MKRITKGLLNLMTLGILVVIIVAIASALNPFNWKEAVFKSSEEKQIAKLEKELDEYKKAEKKEDIRKQEIEEQLIDPKIIQDELINVGKIISLESKAKYKNYIKEEKFLGDRELYIDATYKFGMSMDLSNITYEVQRGEDIIFGEKVVVTVPKDKINVEYVERVITEKDVDGDSGLLVSEFSPEDVNKIYGIAKKQVKEHIENDREVRYKAHENLKAELSKMIMQLGFKNIEFSE